MSIIQSPYQIFSPERQDFLNAALDIFRYQAKNCSIYHDYLNMLKVDVARVSSLREIPFLPIQFFKTHKVISRKQEEYTLFESSASTSQIPSQHYIADMELYNQSLLQSFESAMGPVANVVVLGLLPHYLEKKNSSLIYMVDYLMQKSGRDENGFYLDKQDELFELLKDLEQKKQPTILFGVTFALLDFAKKFSADLQYVKIIETGGMKGRAQEISRAQVHDILQGAFGNRPIYSEYGMAELLSQSYYLEDKVFTPPSWKRILVRDIYDPLTTISTGKGALNIIDLANMYSCSFIATEDIGEVQIDGKFSVLGRLDVSEVRGCNLLLES